MPQKAKIGTRPNEFKYGMALYGAAWPPGDHFFVSGGGGHGLVNRCARWRRQPAAALLAIHSVRALWCISELAAVHCSR